MIKAYSDWILAVRSGGRDSGLVLGKALDRAKVQSVGYSVRGIDTDDVVFFASGVEIDTDFGSILVHKDNIVMIGDSDA